MSTLTQLVTRYRSKLDDLVEDYLWSNDDLTDYVNETVNELCRDIPVVEDSTTVAVCKHVLAPDDQIITLSGRITVLKKAKLASQSDPLELRSSDYMDENYPDWENADSGTPEILVTEGVGTDTAYLYPPTDVADILWLTVYRLPVTDLSWDSDQNTAPGIPSRYHDLLENGVLMRAYGKQDVDTYDEKKVKTHAALWEKDKEAVRRAVIKSRSRPKMVRPLLGYM